MPVLRSIMPSTRGRSNPGTRDETPPERGRCGDAWEDRPESQTIPRVRGGAVSETYATLKTNRGDIVIHLFPNHAPKTVENFVGLAQGTQDYQVPETGKKSPDK